MPSKISHVPGETESSPSRFARMIMKFFPTLRQWRASYCSEPVSARNNVGRAALRLCLCTFTVATFSPAIALPPAFAQFKPTMTIDEDCQAFAISQENRIVYAVPRIKRLKKVVIERDEIWVADWNGHTKRIVDVDKFMPIDHPSSYVVNSLSWSPDGRRIAMGMMTMPPELRKLDQSESSNETGPPGGGKAIALFGDNGQEIRVAGSKTRFIENGSNPMWLADDVNVAYLTGGGPYKIMRVNTSDGKTTTLFAGHTFDNVVWDARDNLAYAVGSDLSILGKTVIVQLNLMHETVEEIARLSDYRGELSISPSRKKIAFFADGDTVEVVDLANPQKPVRVHAGYGRFEWSHDERRLLLKRGPDDQTNDLVWVGLADDSFTPILHDLPFHDFHIAPNGESIVVMDPGKRVLKVFPLD